MHGRQSVQAVFAARQCMHAWSTLRLGFVFPGAAPLAPDSCPLAKLADSIKLADSARDAKDAVEAEGRMAAGVGTLSLSLPEEPTCSSGSVVSVRQDGPSISWHCRAASRGGDSRFTTSPAALDCSSCLGAAGECGLAAPGEGSASLSSSNAEASVPSDALSLAAAASRRWPCATSITCSFCSVLFASARRAGNAFRMSWMSAGMVGIAPRAL